MCLVKEKRPCIASFVRVPCNRSEAPAKAVLCNLGRVSDLAARVPVGGMVIRANSDTARAVLSAGFGGERGQSHHHQATHGDTYNIMPQRAGIKDINKIDSQDKLEMPPTKKAKTTNQVPEGLSDPGSFSPATQRTQNSQSIVPVVNLTQLKKDNEQLRQENLNLRRQVSLFKQLARNPERLKAVLAKLNQRHC